LNGRGAILPRAGGIVDPHGLCRDTLDDPAAALDLLYLEAGVRREVVLEVHPRHGRQIDPLTFIGRDAN